MCAQRKAYPRPSSWSRSLPWLGAGAGVAVVVVGAFWWGLGRPSRSSATADPRDPAMVRLMADSVALGQEFARIAGTRQPTDADLQQLQKAIDFQNEWMRATASTDPEQERRLQDLQAMYDSAWLRTVVARSQAAEAAGRERLAAGQHAEGVARLREAVDLQRLLNQHQSGTGRDLPRETMLAQEIERLEAEPISAELASQLVEAEKLRDARQAPAALAAYHHAHELQLRLNREFSRTQFSNLAMLETIEGEIATLDSAALLAEVMDLSGQAAEAQSRGQSSDTVAALFAQAAAVQQRLNTEFPRSRHVSTERVDTLEVARQTELSSGPARRVAQLDREVAMALRVNQLAGVLEKVKEGAVLSDAIATRLPRSRRIDPEQRVRFNYLWLQRDELSPLLASLAGAFRVIPGSSASLQRTEVSQRLYRQIMQTNPSRQAGDELPVESVSAPDAVEFCRRLAWVLGRPVRLPSEGEFRAALGRVPEGDELAAQAWGVERSQDKPRAVGAGAVNSAGYADLLGNVAEWLAPDSAEADQAPVAGGSYAEPTTDLAKVPVVKRSRLERARTIGFRVVAE
ncbi:MAG: SUMF1/EgtB/PvdO family nonheme iron enzyme [Opitutaceae bacterium]|nr:SUMF1/EgtB/PvdO family nonheme iron enzyme [Opitutaceae bacterium]